MKKVYIAHPLRGGTRDINVALGNVSHATVICRRIAAEHPNTLILSPIHAFNFVGVFDPQDWVLSQCRALLELADELWVFGDWESSEGCRMEIEYARKLGIPIVFSDGCGETQCQGLDA